MHPEQVKIVLNKLDTFTNKYADTSLFAFEKKDIQKLMKKDVFKIVNLDKNIMFEEVLSSTQVFNSSFVNNIKDPCTDKAYIKNRSVLYTYKNEKKNLILMHLSKILEVSQDNSSCLIIII